MKIILKILLSQALICGNGIFKLQPEKLACKPFAQRLCKEHKFMLYKEISTIFGNSFWISIRAFVRQFFQKQMTLAGKDKFIIEHLTELNAFIYIEVIKFK